MRKLVSIMAAAVVAFSLIIGCSNSVPFESIVANTQDEKSTVTYDANNSTGGTVPTDSACYSSGDSVTVPGNTGNLERNGYVFGGWNTMPDGSGTTYIADETFEITENITLYAKWNPILTLGGRVFYMHEDNGLTYTFYDENYNVIEVTQSNDEIRAAGTNKWDDVRYYSFTGHKTGEDKFYVVNSKVKETGKDWGGYCEKVGAHYNNIGSGRKNTRKAMKNPECFLSFDCMNETIWRWIRDDVNAKNASGCNDWYIPCMKEFEELIASGLGPTQWFKEYSVWTSVENKDDPSLQACYYGNFSHNFETYYKTRHMGVIAVRSF